MGLFSRLFGKKKSKAEAAPVREEESAKHFRQPEEAEETSAAKTEPVTPSVEEPVAETPVAEPVVPADDTPEAATNDVPAEEETMVVLTEPEQEAPVAEEPETVETAPPEDETPVAEPTHGHNGPVGRFEIKKAKDGRFVFNLYAPNRVIVATSQVYSSSSNAVNGINSIIANAKRAPTEDTTLKTYDTLGFPKWEIYLDKGGQYRFRLWAPNGSCIVHSQGYTSKANCKNGIESIKRNSENAIVDKAYLKKEEN